MKTFKECMARVSALLATSLVLVLPAAADLSVSTEEVNFGYVQQGSSTSEIISITNDGADNVTHLELAVRGPDFSHTNCPSTLFPGQACNVTVFYTPLKPGANVKHLNIDSDRFSRTVKLRGYAEPFDVANGDTAP